MLTILHRNFGFPSKALFVEKLVDNVENFALSRVDFLFWAGFAPILPV